MWKKTADRLLPIVLNDLTKLFPVLARNLRNVHSSQVALQYGKGSTEKSLGTPANEKSDDNASEVDRERISSSNTVSREKCMTNSLGRYQVYRNEDSEIILDVEEERRKLEFPDSSEVDELSGINIKRGISGVFDIHELVDVLRKQKAQDIFVISVPPSYNYVSHMVIATGRSARHLKAIAEFLNKVYKRKKSKPDPYFKIEGLNSNDWMAMDLGNIAVHIFLKSTREVYDLESLWALGAELDYMCKKADDPLITLLKSPINVEDLEPSSTNTPR